MQYCLYLCRLILYLLQPRTRRSEGVHQLCTRLQRRTQDYCYYYFSSVKGGSQRNE